MNQISILENIFTNQINVLSIAVRTESILIDDAIKMCEDMNYDLQLVKDENNDVLIYEKKHQKIRPLRDIEVISETTSLFEVLSILCEHTHIFIKEKRQIKYIVTRADLDSIAVRIWLFGMISLFENELRHKILSHKINWERCITRKRLLRAENLYQLKKSRNEEVDLLYCIQLIDFLEIITQNIQYFKCISEMNVSVLNKKFSDLNILRDNLAHSQKLNFEWIEVFNLIFFANQFLQPEQTVQV